MKLALERQVQLAFSLALILLLTLGFFAYRNSNSLNEAIRWEKHTQEVLLKLDDTLASIIDAEGSARGFIITGDESFLEPYNQSEQKTGDALRRLQNLTADNPNQTKNLAELENLNDQKLAFLKRVVELRRNQKLNAAIELTNSGEGKALMDDIRRLVGKIKDEEKSLLVEREADLDKSVTGAYRILFLGTIIGIFSLGLANFALAREAGRRRKAEDELREANRNLEKNVEERTRQLSDKNNELEEQIREREQTENRRRIALESGSLGTWTLDPKNNRAEIDERSLSLFGLSAGDFDGSSGKAFSRIHEEDFPRLEKMLQKSIAEKDKFNAEFRVLLPDGKVRWNYCTGQPLLDENGEIKHIIGHCRDVTENKENELSLRQSEQNVRDVIDNLFAFVGVLSPDGILIEANRPALEAAALKAEDVIGRHFAETYWWSYAEDVQKQLREAIEKALEGARVRYDATIRIGDDKFIPIDFMLAPLFDENGRVARLIPSGLDLTPRKQAEDALRKSENFARAILNSLSAHIAVLDKDGNIVAVNEAWQNFAKANCVEEQIHTTGIGQNYLQVCENADAFEADTIEVLENLRSVLQGETTDFSFEYPCHSRTEERWFILQVSSMQESGGAVISHIDITDRKKAERVGEELLKREQAARRDAEIANRMRDEFLATVSHELRAPLNSILGWARMLEKGKLDEKTAEKAVTTIVRNAEAQNRLIEDLLDVSRIISGKLRLEVMTVKPINVVEQALETVRPAAEAKGIHLEIKENPDVSHISGDPNRLQQVIWNLLSNAIKFTPNEGTVRLEIERNENFVEIKVRDTGVGIKEEFLPHVFDRFTQADASSIRKFGGLGLGLAIVRHITEMHGGTVHAFSAGENKGSTFVVRLPLAASPTEAETENQARVRALAVEPTLSLDGLLILVVDDDEDTRQLLVQSLTLYGATVISAASAAGGLSELEEKKPDVLVSDIGMPDEDGYSFIRKVRALSDEKLSRLPAIALTAFTRAQDRMRALSSGYQSHVAKPVEPDELVTVIASLTGRLQIGEKDGA